MADDPVVGPVETTAIVVKNPDGSDKVLLKGKDGKFVRKNKPMPVSSQEIKRIGRKALMKMRKGGKKREIDHLVETAIKWMNYDPGINPETNEPYPADPKMVAASKQWADWYFLNFIGKPGLTEEDKEDNKLSGVKFVVIQAPELPNREVMSLEDRDKAPAKPSFIDAEIISTNE